MASSLISNSHHIDFETVFEMEDTYLVQMFESLIATGLKNFLGCPAMFNEAALTEFFANSSVREDGLVVSTVNGVTVEISEEVFAATFELPVEGLTDLSDVPKNLVFDARSLFSISKEQERDLYYASLPRISIHDKGKEILEEVEPVRGNPARETVELICGDVDFLVQLRNKPWTATASKIIDLLSVSHSKSLEDLIAQQKEQGLPIEQPCTSTVLDTSVGSGAVLAQFYSMAKSTCWVRTLVLIDGVWTPIQGNDFLRSSCKLSLFVNRKKLPKSVVEEEFVPRCYLIEPVQYWGAAPSLIKTWGWAHVCIEIVRYHMFGCLRPVREDICRDIVVSNLGVERIPTGVRRIFRQGMDSNSFVNSFVQLDSVDIQSIQEFESASSDGSTVYRSPSPIFQKDDSFDQEELFYIVESPESYPSILQRQESTSLSSDSQMHFDSNDFPLDDTTEAQTSLPAATDDLSSLLDDLKSSLSQHAGNSAPDARYSNPDASYSALETVAGYSGLQNQTQDIVIQTQATVL
ncbi:hypothetical protein F511_44213 [Dorcoceras hygrometricum]|uniref:Uncharacterized protein n=1 Tax=Dorcoceras hygrometricum TaxID=472368 RepID=A0A2Z7AD69_9LAMI|nr:hypothetical protein F511_44213 [Dorcoceras hygrometricum]